MRPGTVERVRVERLELGGQEAMEFEPDRRRACLLLPGAAYPPSAPLLWFARETFLAAGWGVVEIWSRLEDSDAGAWADRMLDAGSSHLGHRLGAVVAKSASTLIADRVAREGIGGIWLTPLMRHPRVLAGLPAITAPTLVVGSVDDPTWSVQASVRLRRSEVLQLTGADHALQARDDPMMSIELLARVVGRYRELVRRLG